MATRVGIDLAFVNSAMVIDRNGIYDIFVTTNKPSMIKKSKELVLPEFISSLTIIRGKGEVYEIIEAIAEFILSAGEEAIINMEGYAFAARNPRLAQMHEFGGIVKYLVIKAGRKINIINNKSLKKKITGKGNASKEEMIMAADDKFRKFLFDIVEEGIIMAIVKDIADAYHLAKFVD